MTLEKQDILEDFYAGNSKDIQVTIVDVAGNPVDLTGAELIYSLFSDAGEVKFEKSSVYNEVEITDAVNGVCVVHILSSDTRGLQDIYRHQLSMVDATGNASMVLTGKVVIFANYAMPRYRKSVQPAFLQGVTP